MIWLLAIYAVFCLVFAKWNAVRIEQGKEINHDRNGVIHGIFYGVAIFINLFTHEWFLLVAMPFVGRLFFDTALDLFRGKKLSYVSDWVKSGDPRSSKIDRIEYAVFKSGLLPKLLYLIILITIIIIYYATS